MTNLTQGAGELEYHGAHSGVFRLDEGRIKRLK